MTEKKVLFWPFRQWWFWIIPIISAIYRETTTHNIQLGLIELSLGNLIATIFMVWAVTLLFRITYVAGYKKSSQ